MKKMLLSAAAFAVVAVSAVAVAPTTSEAVPAFARQTGAACLSCHFMSFPTLSSFGRSFKVNGFTDVGEQALVEDEGLSIPASLNITAVIRPQFVNVSTGGAAPAVKSATITADQVLLIGGRFGTNSGIFIEYDGATPFANIQIMNSFDFGSFRGGVNIFNTGFGETAGLEVSSVFGQHGGMLNGKALSAANGIGSLGGNTGGLAFWAANDWAMASVSLISDGAALGGVSNSWKLAPSFRVFVQPEVAGWETGIGFGITNGSTGNATTAAAVGFAGTNLKMKKWFIDAQAHGEMGDTQIGLYADFASASASTATETNLFNTATGDLEGWHVRGNIKPTHNLIFGAGFGELKTKNSAGLINGSKTTQWQIAAEYEVYQNFVIALIYNNSKVAPAVGASTTTKTTTLDIEALI